jgi:single-stranded-DNA-specific exonuclease
MKIKNLDKAAKRIIKAVKNKEKIIIFGDADLDGTASVIILEETIKNIGGTDLHIFFQDRETEGYGLNLKALGRIKKLSPALLITVDCGIGNFDEIDLANKMKFEVVVVDHH